MAPCVDLSGPMATNEGPQRWASRCCGQGCATHTAHGLRSGSCDTVLTALALSHAIVTCLLYALVLSPGPGLDVQPCPVTAVSRSGSDGNVRRLLYITALALSHAIVTCMFYALVLSPGPGPEMSKKSDWYWGAVCKIVFFLFLKRQRQNVRKTHERNAR